MSFLDLFTGNSAPAPESAPNTAPAATPAPTGADQVNQPPQQQADPNAPADASQTPPAPPANPLDAFKDLLDNKGTDGQEPTEAPKFSLDPEQLNKVAETLDLNGVVSQDHIQKLQQGDFSVLGEIITNASRQTYLQAMQHGASLTDAFVDSRLQHDAKGLSGRIKQELTQNEFAGMDLNHPTVQAQLTATAQQLQQKYPDATPQWIAQQSKVYLTELSKALNPQQNSPEQQTKQNQEVDWSEFLK